VAREHHQVALVGLQAVDVLLWDATHSTAQHSRAQAFVSDTAHVRKGIIIAGILQLQSHNTAIADLHPCR
jgi:hypothetical protein